MVKDVETIIPEFELMKAFCSNKENLLFDLLIKRITETLERKEILNNIKEIIKTEVL